MLINNETVAYGVQYRRHGIPQIAYASKEVIISAGVFISPMLLIKSGVGPIEVLNNANVTNIIGVNAARIINRIYCHLFLIDSN